MTSTKCGYVLTGLAALLMLACGSSVDRTGEPEAIASAEEPLDVEFCPAACDQVFTREHYVPVGDGATLHVVEKFTLASIATFPNRALLMLTGTLVTNKQYDTDVPGDESYDALVQAARQGYFAYSASYEGYGLSSHPEDGSTVTADRMLVQMGDLVEWIRHRRGVPKVDLMGASLGSSLCVALGGELSPIPRRHVGRIVLTSHVYKEVTPLFQEIFFNPELLAFLQNAPNGYVETGPDAYGLILSHVTPEVGAWAYATFPGEYATGPTLEGFDLPVFDAEYGRAPALQVWGDQDPITPLSDVARFQSEYGGLVDLAVIPGGAHALTLEPTREQMWNAVFAFLDEGAPYGHHFTCPRFQDSVAP